MSKRKRASYNIKISVLDALDNIPRKEMRNKSKLVEELLEKWLDKRTKNMEKKLS